MFLPTCLNDLYTQEDLENVTKFLKLIAEPNRLLILCLLQHGELSVNQIQERLNIPLNLLSFHLQKLKKLDNLICSKKKGLNVFYFINQTKISFYKKILDKVLVNKKT